MAKETINRRKREGEDGRMGGWEKMYVKHISDKMNSYNSVAKKEKSKQS